MARLWCAAVLLAAWSAVARAAALRADRPRRHQKRPASQKSIFARLIASQGEEVELAKTKEGWYAASIKVDGQAVQLAVDTGSEVFWVRGAKLSAGQPNASTPAASAPPSSDAWGFLNAVDVHKFSVQYGRGHVSGEVRDVGVQLVDEKAHSCAVGREVDESGIWAHQHTIDGVLGLACDGNVQASSLRCLFPEPEESAADGDAEGDAQAQLSLAEEQPQRVFSLQLRKDGGKLSVGVIPAEYRESLYFMPPAKHCGKWTAPLLAMSASGASKLSTPSQALLDSGTNGIVGPTFDVIAIAQTLGATPAPTKDGYGGEVTFYNVPCAAKINLAPVTLTLGRWGAEANVTLNGDDLVAEGAEDSETCRLRLAGWETESWILGAAFLEHLKAVVFNLDKHMVGLSL